MVGFFIFLRFENKKFIFVMWYLYMCNRKGQLYTGITTDLDNRMRQHGNAKLLYIEENKDRKIIAKREREIKGWKRNKKLELIHGKNIQ